MTNHLICLTLGKTGVGKSSFINAITGKKDCKVSSESKACTKSYEIIETQRIDEKFIFIDTPGLNDAKGDENNIRKVTDAIAEHPNFRAFLILLNFTDTRLDASVVSTLIQYMAIFPIKDFWKHTIIIRTHAKKDDDDFEDDKKKIENAIVKSLLYPEFKEFKSFMQENNIDLPNSIQEFYVNNNNDKFERTIEKNKTEFDNICKAIKHMNPLFKKIKKYEFQEIDNSGKFEKQIHKIKMTFIPYYGEPIYSNPIIVRVDELSKYPKLRVETRYEYGSVRGKCKNKEIERSKYETNIYLIDKKEVRGSECFKGTEWISK